MMVIPAVRKTVLGIMIARNDNNSRNFNIKTNNHLNNHIKMIHNATASRSFPSEGALRFLQPGPDSTFSRVVLVAVVVYSH